MARKPSYLQGLIAHGFDLSEHVPFTKRYTIRCSQCQACSINGVPCHERHCPNIPRDYDRDEEN